MTFHVRLVSPPDQTEGLVGLLAANCGVSNLVVLPGTARRPDGDAVQFDVRSRSANSVFRHLEAFQADHSGAVGIKQVDATLGEGVSATAQCDRADRGGRADAAPGANHLAFPRRDSTAAQCATAWLVAWRGLEVQAVDDRRG